MPRFKIIHNGIDYESKEHTQEELNGIRDWVYANMERMNKFQFETVNKRTIIIGESVIQNSIFVFDGGM